MILTELPYSKVFKSIEQGAYNPAIPMFFKN